MFYGYDFHIFWGAREENPAEIAQRLAKMMRKLKRISPLLAAWSTDAMDLDGHRISTSVKALEPFIAKGVYRRDDNRKVIADLGYSTSLCNAFDDGSFVSMRVDAGCWSEFSHNSFRMNFPVITDVIKPLMSVDRILLIFRILIECWEPESGHFDSSYLAKDLDWPKIQFNETDCYWVSYYGSNVSELPELPEEVNVIQEKKNGRFLVLIDDSFAETGTGDVELVRRTRSILSENYDQSSGED
ncbi:Imm52 family immunity protein [Gimesia sp.]|uniref:Imm52 family immunity protein n=1 Tax=Gimesia sp. TaxID=2024833 RepID=UPI000C5D69EA|nr:Imm52 family immunity protein [Gimesia sp.]MAX40942.1 hypothetical protein [Gimesia sp.]HAH44082.1 hypothetical protein [Planctomycetaceae bacterium]HBL42555.1 hypothetical protein [Planctomycetaceae bacterium]|tara:strand:- start:8075 stop:8803 length:729 start_codon:yes stop_codon:yes gene_type:complete